MSVAGIGVSEKQTAMMIANAIILHLAGIEDKLDALLASGEANSRIPESWMFVVGGNAPGGATFNLGPVIVPVGKRLALKRVATTAPATTGTCAIYAGLGPQLDGSNLIEVIPTPQLQAGGVANLSPIRGGLVLMASFLTAAAGIHTVRYEGELFPDQDPRDLAH